MTSPHVSLFGTGMCSNIADYERRAMLALPKGAFEYFAGGANDMLTLRENR